MQIKTKIVSWKTANSKWFKQEVNGTRYFPPLVFRGIVNDARKKKVLKHWWQIVAISITATMASIGAAGIPQAGNFTATDGVEFFKGMLYKINYACKSFIELAAEAH